MKSVKFILVLFFIYGIAYAQDNYKSSIEFEKLAVKNYLSRNYDLFLLNIKKADELRPNHPRIIYNLAAAYSLNNKKKDALNELQKLINMKLFYPVEKDSDFTALHEDSDFKNIIHKFKENLAPEGNSIISLYLS